VSTEINKYVALLRGINVGGKRKILMAELKKVLLSKGFTDVETYIQSGNVVFNSKEVTPVILENEISDLIKQSFGHDVPVVVRTQEEWDQLMNVNPFKAEDIDKLHICFLKEEPTQDRIDKLRQYPCSPDQWHIRGKEVHILCNGKYHLSKIGNTTVERQLGVPSTARNYKTIMKLQKMLCDKCY